MATVAPESKPNERSVQDQQVAHPKEKIVKLKQKQNKNVSRKLQGHGRIW